MTVVEYENWLLWMSADASNTYGKDWVQWMSLPHDIKSQLIEEHLDSGL